MTQTEARPGTDPPGEARRIRVLYNARSGVKAGIPTNRAGVDDVRRVMREHGLGDDLVTPADETGTRAAARDAVAEGIDVVVAAGGDGSAHMVAEELVDTTTALGILPMGTVMNVARMLRIPLELDAAAAVIGSGPIRPIDVGVAREQLFIEAGSVGLNAAIFREVARVEGGDWLAVARTIWVAFRYRPSRMAIRLDDRRIRTRALAMTASVGPYVGAAMEVAPDARPDDGKFDVVIFRHFSKWELIRHLGSIAFGRRRYVPHVSTYRSSRVCVESRHPLPCRADGRDLGSTPIEFRTRPGVLRVVAPAD
ncbi:MAG: diacylglycerol/lipid kinase family protein [Chloroflexota bacterium]